MPDILLIVDEPYLILPCLVDIEKDFLRVTLLKHISQLIQTIQYIYR